MASRNYDIGDIIEDAGDLDDIDRLLADHRRSTPANDEAGWRTPGMNHGSDRQFTPLQLLSTSELRSERRDLTAGVLTSGGVLSLPAVVRGVEMALSQLSPIRRVASVSRDVKGGQHVIPVCDDDDGIGVLVGEVFQPNDIDLAFQALTLQPRKINSGLVAASNSLLEDAPDAFQECLGKALGARVARRADASIYTPALQARSAVGKTAASASALTGDEVLDLVFAVAPDYRESPSAAFMMHSSTLKYILQLKGALADTYLYDRNTRRLLGFPVMCNDNLADTLASGALSVFFGAWEAFHCLDTRATRLIALTEPRAEQYQTVYGMILHTDGGLRDSNAIKCISH